MKHKKGLLIAIYLPVTAIAAAELSSPAWATDKTGATKVLEGAGLTPKTVGGYAWFQCGKDDTFATKFSAVNKEGQPVEGAVCKGLIVKNSTIRYK